MTLQYLIGELSVRLEQLQLVAARDTARDVARLRREIEAGAGLAPPAERASELADLPCWQSLICGDIPAFTRQAEVSADLRLLGVCSHLLTDH